MAARQTRAAILLKKPREVVGEGFVVKTIPSRKTHAVISLGKTTEPSNTDALHGCVLSPMMGVAAKAVVSQPEHHGRILASKSPEATEFHG